MRIIPIIKERCCKCKDRATSWMDTKPYCKKCFERQWYKGKTKRERKKKEERLIQIQLNQGR